MPVVLLLLSKALALCPFFVLLPVGHSGADEDLALFV
jgi:hypothetical protein